MNLDLYLCVLIPKLRDIFVEHNNIAHIQPTAKMIYRFNVVIMQLLADERCKYEKE